MAAATPVPTTSQAFKFAVAISPARRGGGAKPQTQESVATLTSTPESVASPHPGGRRRPPTLPGGAGLSLLSEKGGEEGIVPCCGIHFSTHRDRFWVGSKEVEGKPAQDCEVFGCSILSRLRQTPHREPSASGSRPT